jgi:tyrosyl-tRNA synthetase
MLAGLKKDQIKMSKSMTDSAIFMEDSEEEVRAKIKNAFCPEKEINDNPVAEYVKFVVFGALGYFQIKRDEKFGGDM